jgi:hypothetical protein
MNSPRKITIEAVLNGFVCKVGCQTVVFNSIGDLVANLGDYLRNPAAVENQFRANAVNRALLSGIETVPGMESEACPTSPPPPYDSCDKPSAPVSLRQAIYPAKGQCEANQCGTDAR